MFDHEMAKFASPLLSSLGCIPLPHGRPRFFCRELRQLFQFLQRGVVGVIVFSRGFGYARLVYFLFDASEYRLVGFLLGLVLVHTCIIARTRTDCRSIWYRASRLWIILLVSRPVQS